MRADADVEAAKSYAESIIATLHEPLLVLTPDLRVRSANRAFYDSFAVRGEDTIGRRVYELGNGQWDIPELRTLLEDVLPDSHVFNDYEVAHDFEDVGHRVMLLNARRLDHEQLILLGIRDVTARRADEQRHAFLLRLSDELRPLAEPGDVLDAAARLLGEYLGVARAMYAEVAGDPGREVGTLAGRYEGPVAAGLPPFPERYDYAAYGEAVMALRRGGHPMVVSDVVTDPRFGDAERAAWLGAGVRAAVTVPLVKRGRFAADFGVQSTVARDWTPGEVELVVETAERTWAAVERSRVEAALREREARQGELLEQRAAALDREQAARAEAERALRVRDEFLAIVSHELRTPLTAIMMWADLSRKGKVPGREREALDTIARNAEAQRVLIEDLLDASRFMSGNVRLDVRPSALVPLLADVVDAMRPAAAERRVRLDFAPDQSLVRSAVDAERFAQALRALVDNAIRYSDPGGVVTVSVSEERGNAVVRVADTGHGIDPDTLPHVFERFRRGGEGGGGGLGLGLAIAHDIIELHGGTIAAESPGKGRGSVFTLSLPAVGDAPRSSRPKRGQRSRALSGRLAGLRILVVEDDVDTLEALRLSLQVEGAAVSVATGGREAIEMLRRSGPFDAVVSDLSMPDGDGFAVVRAVRAADGDRRTRAVAVTASVLEQQRVRALDAGFDACLAKPVAVEALVAALSS